MINRAIFSDLDNTLIKTKSGNKFPKDTNDWILDYTVLDSIYGYMKQNLTGTLCIVTNQGGVESGYIKRSDFLEKIDNIKDAIAQYFIDTYSYVIRIDSGICFTNDKKDFMRKPNPGLGYSLALRNNLILTQCVMIGDADGSPESHSDADVGFASNCVMNFHDIETFVMFYNPNDIYKKPF